MTPAERENERMEARVSELIRERDAARAWAKAWKRAATENREKYALVWDANVKAAQREKALRTAAQMAREALSDALARGMLDRTDHKAGIKALAALDAALAPTLPHGKA